MNSSTETVEITAQGIRKVLNKYTPERAIAEYIWNGFDARATEVRIEVENGTAFDNIVRIVVKDNGDGIVYEELPVVFKRFYESHKTQGCNVESRFSRGKNGYGRFTFFKFASVATWHTVYQKEGGFFEYTITMLNERLKQYEATIPSLSEATATKTKVVFTDITNDCLAGNWTEVVLIPYLKAEFAWYFKVHDECRIYVNNEQLDCSSVIADSEFFDLPIRLENIDDELFHCKYFRWTEKSKEEYSRFYYMSADGELKHQKTTLYNNKGDSFWHSVVITSTFFNHLADIEDEGNTLFSSLPERKVFKALNDQLNDYLKDKRRPFLKEQADNMIEKYESEEVFSFYGTNRWDLLRKEELLEFIRGLYEVEPSVFLRLNKSQKKVFIRLLDLVMDVDNNKALFDILEQVVELDNDSKERFAELLKTTKLKNVISTIQLINDRISTIKALREVNFNKDLKAGEVKHLQKLIEGHYWIFGEEYRLVCAEEAKFQEALNKYKYILYGIKEEEYIEHPDQYKEMDLFITGQDYRNNRPSNLVVEIKSPTNVPKLNLDHYSQINKYMGVIMDLKEFQDPNAYWTFLLAGLSIDANVERQITDKLIGTCLKQDNCQLIVKTWGQILNEADARMKFLLEKLETERDKLSVPDELDKLMEETLNNSAVMHN